MRQIRVRRLNEQVIVVRHQTIPVTEPPVALNNLAENLEEFLAVMIREEDRIQRIATACDVIDRAFKFESQWSCHADSLAQRIPRKKT